MTIPMPRRITWFLTSWSNGFWQTSKNRVASKAQGVVSQNAGRLVSETAFQGWPLAQPSRKAYLFKEKCNGFSERFVGLSEAAEEVLAVAADCHYLDVRRPDGVCQRVRDRAIYLYAVLTDLQESTT